MFQVTLMLSYIVLFYVANCTMLCDTVYSCSNETITTNNSIWIRAYRGGSSLLTKIFHTVNSSQVWVSGAWGAENIHSIQSEAILCASAYSCANTITNITHNNILLCRGAGSCDNTTIVTGTAQASPRCQAGGACMNSIIKTGNYFEATGGYSAMGSIMYSFNDEAVSSYTVYFDFFGWFSGFNTTIVCDDSLADCYVRCYNIHGCNNTRFICNNGAQCTTDCDNDADCPTIEYNITYSGTINDEFVSTKIAEFDPYYVDYIGLIKQENDRCDNEADSITFDAYYYDPGNSIAVLNNTNSNVCCRAGSSCQNFNSITTNNSDSNIVCGGTSSCYGVTSIVTDNKWRQYLLWCKFIMLFNKHRYQ